MNEIRGFISQTINQPIKRRVVFSWYSCCAWLTFFMNWMYCLRLFHWESVRSMVSLKILAWTSHQRKSDSAASSADAEENCPKVDFHYTAIRSLAMTEGTTPINTHSGYDNLALVSLISLRNLCRKCLWWGWLLGRNAGLDWRRCGDEGATGAHITASSDPFSTLCLSQNLIDAYQHLTNDRPVTPSIAWLIESPVNYWFIPARDTVSLSISPLHTSVSQSLSKLPTSSWVRAGHVTSAGHTAGWRSIASITCTGTGAPRLPAALSTASTANSFPWRWLLWFFFSGCFHCQI